LVQEDVRQLQLAKGAIRTAIAVLLDEAGVTLPDRLIVAGGFGTRLDQRSAEQIGLFPRGIAHYECAGNTSLDGSARLLSDDAMRERIESSARRLKTLNLAESPNYLDRFAGYMGFNG
jgi:uncharacterized 2Fe-2S/4Fe-4S cluster protein (DUF4445 family)